MDQPVHRGPVELAISRIDRRIVFQHILQHVKVAVERRPMQWHGAMLRQRRRRPAIANEVSSGGRVVIIIERVDRSILEQQLNDRNRAGEKISPSVDGTRRAAPL